MNAALILAGGQGARLGGGVPKQYREVLGRPVLAYALEAFQRAPDIDAIAVVCRPEWAAHVRALARRFGIDKLRWVCDAGPACQDSIRGGVYALRDSLADDDLLMLHMAVSPLITPAGIAEGLRVCREKGCSFAMYPVNVCMARRVAEDWTDQNAPKEDYIELNAPWTFRYGALYALYREADRLGLGRRPEDYALGLWLAMGHRAHYYRGEDAARLKITTAFDLELFEALLEVRRQKEIAP